MQYTITEIARIIGAKEFHGSSSVVSFLLTDSRSLVFPDECLFFALKTLHNDGHRYVAELYAQNVRNFVISEWHPEFDKLADACFLLTNSPIEALQRLAAWHRSRFGVPVIGITGSNGKTIVKEWLYQLLHNDQKIVRSPRSYNSQIGAPLSVWQLDDSAELGIFEAGISLPGEMQRLQPIIAPDICILTNIGEAHQENFTSQREKCLEKLKLAISAQTLIYCSDNPLVDACASELKLKARRFVWSKTSKEATLFIVSVEKIFTHTKITFVYNGVTTSVKIPFMDNASVENAIHCIACLLCCGTTADMIAERLPLLEPVAMRLEVVQAVNRCIVINDSYNSDLLSLDIALDFQMRRDAVKKMKHTLILSDMLQSGIANDELYRRIARLVRQRNVDKFIGIGQQLFENRHVFVGMEHVFFETTSDFLKAGGWKNFHNELILLKGSRMFHFEEITEALSLKLHETILEIDLNAIVHNFNVYRSMLRTSTKIICMVKAFAYGAGSLEVAKTLQEHRCDYLAVAVADEGAELRRNGILIPLMVMNPEMSAFRTIFDYRLEPEIYSFRLLNAFIREADRLGIVDYPVHIKIDTGMHRLGFSCTAMDELANVLQQQRNLLIVSVFSHLAGSDETTLNQFTHQQIDLFTACCNQLESRIGYRPLRHILNSEGILRFNESQMDMVRLGLGLYGINSAGGLRNVTTLKTTVLQIRNVPAGDTVGYGRMGVAVAPLRVATIPIGYADGFNRKFGNGNLSVLVNGQPAPVIGNVCMDLTMLDVTEIACSEGDTAIVFGEAQPVATLASRLDTIPYEILTSVSNRVKRVYFTE
ncbi:MAG: bifunctional UDP-N-acetylmuramoyl-tripeptide:D-alanyl-D-alanine ligase/alanine racemase [Bacteroidales bacterium]|jgi:alanine racemase|nr:bifunctional UDP-N-acetylmuramoyl-tripeptide:D-alanyl-D-alanine ligase/alanine racemase [Bacteroidales bacterium]